MAEDDLIIYYFDGTGGCDVCNLLTGYSFDEEPRPHPYCDCVVECIDMETEGDCHLELRDAEWDETYDEVVDTSPHRVVCEWFDEDITFSLPTSAIKNLSSELEAVAREKGWSPPDPDTITLSYTIPGLTETFEETMYMEEYYANVEAAWYLVCEIDGNVSAQQVDMEYGDYFIIYDFEIEISDIERCF